MPLFEFHNIEKRAQLLHFPCLHLNRTAPDWLIVDCDVIIHRFPCDLVGLDA